jgi:hypothetical protein
MRRALGVASSGARTAPRPVIKMSIRNGSALLSHRGGRSIHGDRVDLGPWPSTGCGTGRPAGRPDWLQSPAAWKSSSFAHTG